MFSSIEAKPQQLGLFGLGGFGVNSVRMLMAAINITEHPHLRIFLANTDASHLEKFFKDHKDNAVLEHLTDNGQLHATLLGKSELGAGGNPEVGKAAMKDSMEKVEKFLRPGNLQTLNALIALVGLGGGTSGGIFPLVEKTKEFGIPMLVIATLPFSFEDKKRRRRAIQMRDELFKQCPTVVIYNEQCPEDLDVLKAYGHINEKAVVPNLMMLRQLIQEVGVQNRDLADFEATLRGGNRGFTGLVRVKQQQGESEEDVILRVVHDLREKNPYQQIDVLDRSCERLWGFRGPFWTRRTIDRLMACVDSTSRVEEDTENRVGFYPAAEGEDSQVGVIAIAKDLSDETEDFSAAHVRPRSVLISEPVPKSELSPKPEQPTPEPIAPKSVKGNIEFNVPTHDGKTVRIFTTSEFKEKCVKIFAWKVMNGDGCYNGLTLDEIRESLQRLEKEFRLDPKPSSDIEKALSRQMATAGR